METEQTATVVQTNKRSPSLKTLLLFTGGAILILILIISGVYLYSFFVGINAGVEGSGKAGSVTREISQIKSVEIGTIGQVVIERSYENTVTLEADDNFLECFSITDRDNKLVITPKSCLNERNPQLRPKLGVKFTIKTPMIERIAVSGTANVVADTAETRLFTIASSGTGNITANIKASKVEVRLSGIGNVKLTGEATDQDVEITGTGNFNGKDLKGKVGNATLSGTGNATFGVSDALKVKGSGTGNAFYYGNPTLTTSLSGFGKVLPATE